MSMDNLIPVTPDQRKEIVGQIGRGNILAISGGRVTPIETGVELPVGSGYRVRVHLAASDTYTVQRVLVRGEKEFDKGYCEDIYFDEVGDTAYYASCFRNDSEHNGQWHYHNPAAPDPKKEDQSLDEPEKPGNTSQATPGPGQ